MQGVSLGSPPQCTFDHRTENCPSESATAICNLPSVQPTLLAIWICASVPGVAVMSETDDPDEKVPSGSPAGRAELVRTADTELAMTTPSMVTTPFFCECGDMVTACRPFRLSMSEPFRRSTVE